jgi:hypothetical protein
MTDATTPRSAPHWHDGHFLATSMAPARTVVPVTIALGSACGLIRTAVAPVRSEGRIDLRGDCPGR